MSGVIKSGDPGGEVRVLELDAEPDVATPSDEARHIADLEERLAEAGALIEALRDDLARANSAAQGAWAEGRAAGMVEGRKAAEDRSAALLRRLDQSLEAAGEDFRRHLATFEQAAAGLAGLALGRVVGDPAGRRSLVVETVQRASAELFAGSVVAVEVSAADFPDVLSLEPLRSEIGREVVVLDALESGACRLRLRLGEIDLGLDGQVARLRTLLGGPIGASE